MDMRGRVYAPIDESGHVTKQQHHLALSSGGSPMGIEEHVRKTEAAKAGLDSIKERGRGFLVRSMRTCIARDRVPLIAKSLYVTGCQLLLSATGIASDETPLESEYGTKFVAGPGSFWVNSVLRSRGVWEPVLSEFILRHVQEGDVCVDVGANIGYFSLLFAQRAGPSGKVIAIEAAPGTVRRLRANLALNGAAGIVHVVEAACAAQKGEITFYLHPRNDGWCRLSPPPTGLRRLTSRHWMPTMGRPWIPVNVAADTLASILGADAQRVSFIKVDIEGAETAITPHIAAEFSHPRLVVSLEVMPPIKATLRPFQERGFYIYDMHNDYHWMLERRVPAITEAAYSDFYHRTAADVILSRQPLALS